MKKSKKTTKNFTIFALLAFATAALAVANIFASNAVATTGKKLQSLNLKTLELKTQIQRLERDISEKTSLSSIESKASELGLIPIAETLNLTPPEPLAQLPE